MKVVNNDKGFTLIELIVVVAILAIIAGIAIPNIVNSIDSARKGSDIASSKIIADAAARALAMEGKYSGFQSTGIDINDIENAVGGSLVEEFKVELYELVNKNSIVPKYKKAGITTDNFILVIETGRIIQVYVGSGTDITTPNALKIYPEPADIYTD